MREREFLTDQRTTRNMQIGSIDRRVTEMLKRKKTRKDRLHEREGLEKKRKTEQSQLLSSRQITASEHLELSYSDEDDTDSFGTDSSCSASDTNSDINNL